MTPFPRQMGRWCHGLDFLTSPGPSLHITPALQFHFAILSVPKRKDLPTPRHPEKDRAYAQPGLNCSFGFSVAFPATSMQAMPEESPDTLSPS